MRVLRKCCEWVGEGDKKLKMMGDIYVNMHSEVELMFDFWRELGVADGILIRFNLGSFT